MDGLVMWRLPLLVETAGTSAPAAGLVEGDAPGMAEHLEAVAARDGDEGDARRLRRGDGQRRGGGDGDEHGAAGDRHLLHHLDRDVAGERHRTLRHVDALPRHGTTELVERIVPPDILT